MLGPQEQTRTVVMVYQKHGAVVKTVSNPRVIVHKRTNYCYSDGVWYIIREKDYVVIGAPKGIKLRALHGGNKVVYQNGQRILYRGVLHKTRGYHYVVVNV